MTTGKRINQTNDTRLQMLTFVSLPFRLVKLPRQTKYSLAKVSF